MAQSFDGFVAKENGDLSWLMKYDTTGEDHGYETFISKMDVLVMGSGSYNTVAAFEQWPYEIPVYVLSSRLHQENIPEHLQDKVTVLDKQPKELMEFLYKKGFENAYIDGGKLNFSFIKAGLIQEMTITVLPVLIGAGKRIFGDFGQDLELQLIASKTFAKSNFLQLKYRFTTNAS